VSTVPAVTVSPEMAERLREFHRDTWIAQRDAVIVEALEAGGSLREVGELVGLSHTQVRTIADRMKGAQS
jgi:site-specific recombinase XerC